jgi:hypothetical protein
MILPLFIKHFNIFYYIYINFKLTENLGKIYLDFQRHVVRGIIDQ